MYTCKLYPNNYVCVCVLPLCRRVADLSRQQLIDWMRLNQPVMMNIFKRNEYSWRHEKFNTNPKMRGKKHHSLPFSHHTTFASSVSIVAAAMKWRYDSRRFTDDQVKLITDILLKIFCWRHMKVEEQCYRIAGNFRMVQIFVYFV